MHTIKDGSNKHNIVILGANGYIGRALLEAWLKDNNSKDYYAVDINIEAIEELAKENATDNLSTIKSDVIKEDYIDRLDLYHPANLKKFFEFSC